MDCIDGLVAALAAENEERLERLQRLMIAQCEGYQREALARVAGYRRAVRRAQLVMYATSMLSLVVSIYCFWVAWRSEGGR